MRELFFSQEYLSTLPLYLLIMMLYPLYFNVDLIGSLRLYWTPAPPKFDLPPDAVKEQLIPRYQGSSDVAAEEFEMNDDINEEVEEESSSEDDAEQEDSAEFRQR